MNRSSTGELHKELMEAPDLDRFLKENDEKFNSEGLGDALRKVYEKRNVAKSVLAGRAGMSSVYLHQLFSGVRHPTRNKLLCLCIALETSVEEAQELLKRGGSALLYPKIRRDAIIMYGLIHGLNLFEVNDKLFSEGEETLC